MVHGLCISTWGEPRRAGEWERDLPPVGSRDLGRWERVFFLKALEVVLPVQSGGPTIRPASADDNSHPE